MLPDHVTTYMWCDHVTMSPCRCPSMHTTRDANPSTSLHTRAEEQCSKYWGQRIQGASPLSYAFVPMAHHCESPSARGIGVMQCALCAVWRSVGHEKIAADKESRRGLVNQSSDSVHEKRVPSLVVVSYSSIRVETFSILPVSCVGGLGLP